MVNWKVLGIIFMILFFLETSLLIWAVWDVAQEDEKFYLCYYDVCGEYPDADYLDNICYCYDYDVLGDLIVSKTEYMK